MKLTFSKRPGHKKSEVVQLRRAGQIPAVIYHKNQEAESVSISQVEFTAAIRSIVPGRLSTTLFALTDADGKTRNVIVKAVQYNPVNYQVIHIDFEELHDNMPVKIKVPVVTDGEVDSVGIKLGGMIRLVIRSVQVKCLPKDIPSHFLVDVRSMNIGQTVKVADLLIPENVRPLAKSNSVVISMVKK